MVLNKLHPQLQNFVKDKWKGLTEIQDKAFDPIFRGENCTIEAPTSGGKTEAVLFPLLSRIAANKNQGFKVLYIAPLKALLNDLALRIIPYAKMCYMEAFKWHGDVSQSDKVQQMIFPSDILLTTPESIEAILLRKPNWVEVFSNLETIVIDEAHYFALTERGSHLLSLLERINSEINKVPQRIAVTATIGNPGDLLEWILGDKTKGSSIRVESKSQKEKDFLIQYFEEGVGQQTQLYQLLGRKKSIVFERSRSNTEDTASRINEWNNKSGTKFPVLVRTHHSSVSKQGRETAERAIKQSSEASLNAIISTSTLELGIDIGELDQVIQIGGLNSSGSFLQRVGRTGRRVGRPQYFRGLCNDAEELVLLTACVSLGTKNISENILFPKKAFHILAHQVICICLQKLGATKDQIWSILSKPSCFSGITREEFNVLIDYMIQQDFLRIVGREALITSNKTEDEFLRANWKRLYAIFDTGPMYNVVNGKKVIGTLDSGFARTQKLPFIFVLGGEEWNALKLDHEMQQVLVERNTTGLAPKWKAIASFDVPFELAQEVGVILSTNEKLSFLDATAQKQIDYERNYYSQLIWNKNSWLLEESDDSNLVYLWTFAGDKINRAISMLLTSEHIEDPDYDYKKITVVAKKGEQVSGREIYKWLISLKAESIDNLNKLLQNKITVKWFSKFSECLPESLAKKTIQEKGIDLVGLMRELTRIKIIEN